MPDLKRTPLFDAHKRAGARLVDFAGWFMPLWYAGIIEEHQAVRTTMGMFDVSHMGRFHIRGAQAAEWVNRAVVTDVAALRDGRGAYTVMCYEHGGIVDDLIVVRLAPDDFFLVVNAANRQKDFDWLESLRGNCNASLHDASDELAMIALQGPEAMVLLNHLTAGAVAVMQRFDCSRVEIGGMEVLAARTGYTGEDGAELMPAAGDAERLWQLLAGKGAAPCGLGARDTLRLEASLALYGQDIDDTTNPIEAGLGWLIDFDSGEFTGREALLDIKERGTDRKLAGFRSRGREIPRAGSVVKHGGEQVGAITSGGFSPTLRVGIGMGYLPRDLAAAGTNVEFSARGKTGRAEVVRLPFYRRV